MHVTAVALFAAVLAARTAAARGAVPS
jgi:hypothetical protein